MRQRVLIALQETHGSNIDMDMLARSTPHRYRAYHSSIPNNTTAGGVGFLVPFDQVEQSRPPDECPQLEPAA
eukprot:6397705-Pyramimonas_sp.AAC.1